MKVKKKHMTNIMFKDPHRFSVTNRRKPIFSVCSCPHVLSPDVPVWPGLGRAFFPPWNVFASSPQNFHSYFKTQLSNFIFPNLAPYLVFLQADFI